MLLKIAKEKAEYYGKKIVNKLSSLIYMPDAVNCVNENIEDYQMNLLNPVTKARDDLYYSKESLSTFSSTVSFDLELGNKMTLHISDKLNNIFNSNQDFKTSSKNKISSMKYKIDSINEEKKSIFIKDTFNDYNGIDFSLSENTMPDISTSQGILTLKTTKNESLNNLIKTIDISGNGEEGNNGVIRTYAPSNMDFGIKADFLKNTTPNNNKNAIFDGDPVTIFEYQNLKEPVSLNVFASLAQEQKINWIEIEPYIPDKSKSGFRIETIDFHITENKEPIYESLSVKKDISLLPEKGSSNLLNIASQGIINFETKTIDSVNIRLSQNKWYHELMGSTKYLINGFEQAPESLPENIKNGPIGEYKHNGLTIEKKIDIIDPGIRYSIGLRNIEFMYKEFANHSIYISKEFNIPENIGAIKLYSNEYIPQEFLKTSNSDLVSWIRYFISVNDLDWAEIWPQDRVSVEGTNPPPQKYLINSKEDPSIRNISKNGYIDTRDNVNKIRIKIDITRPDELPSLTPIIENYVIACEVVD